VQQRDTRAPASTAADLVSLPDGQSVLVAGEAMTGKRSLLLSVLASRAARDWGTVLVTTRKPPAATYRQFARLDGVIPPDRVSVVDGTGMGTEGGEWASRAAGGPGDLTGIGIGVTEFLREHHQAGRPAQLGLHSLSTMLMYADLKRLFQFVHVTTTRLAATGYAGVFTVDSGVLDGRELSILQQPFDGLVEVREGDAGRELRARGEVEGPREWTRFGDR
jgi:KaiC/GvpD/RAD55 family RecA-like ATPase